MSNNRKNKYKYKYKLSKPKIYENRIRNNNRGKYYRYEEKFNEPVESEKSFKRQKTVQKRTANKRNYTDTTAIKKLITALSEGKCKGIKSAIAYKIAQFALEMELL